MFDPSSFLDFQTTEANDTKLIPPPVGDYAATIDKIDFRQWKKKEDPTQSGVTLDVFWSINDPNVLAHCGRDKVVVKQGIMIDVADSGGLAVGQGKNIGLGKLREATGLNVPGQVFAPSMLPGRSALVKVDHRMGDDGETIYPEIKTVGKLA